MVKITCLVKDERTITIDSIHEKLRAGESAEIDCSNLNNPDIKWYVDNGYLKVDGKIKDAVIKKSLEEKNTKKFNCTLKNGRLVLGSISGGVDAGKAIDIKVSDLCNKDIVSSLNKGWLVEAKFSKVEKIEKEPVDEEVIEEVIEEKKLNVKFKNSHDFLESENKEDSLVMEVDKTPHDSNGILDLNMSEIKVKEDSDDFSELGKKIYQKKSAVKKPVAKKTTAKKKTTTKKRAPKKTQPKKE